MFGIKRITYWSPSTAYQLPDLLGKARYPAKTVLGVYKVKTWFAGDLISDNIHQSKTEDHYLAIFDKQWEDKMSELAKVRGLQAKSEEDFLSSAAGLLMEELDGVVATIQNTFDNGYTSVWNYKIQDGRFIVQKPWGNQARAEFSSIEDMAADFRRYLSYGFTIAG